MQKRKEGVFLRKLMKNPFWAKTSSPTDFSTHSAIIISLKCHFVSSRLSE